MAGVREEQMGMREEMGGMREEMVGLRADVAGLATRLDNALTTTLGEPLRQLQSRVRRLERQVFPGDVPPES